MTDMFGPGFESLQLHFKAFQILETLFYFINLLHGRPKIYINQYLTCSLCQLSSYHADE